jgi:proteasome lid subunit RPN8/RPN11
MFIPLKRPAPPDPDRVRAALARAADRRFRRQLRIVRRHRGELRELTAVVAELSALVAFRRDAPTELPGSLDGTDSIVRGRLPKDAPSPNSLLVTADLTFELHHRLFPAERMIVIAGREVERRMVLTSCFDVTSESRSHAAYTKADPIKLGAALIAIEKSGASLLAWAHSHPGNGASACHPSPTDLRQHTAWTLNYTPLLGFIFTSDGYVRLWGDTNNVQVSGTGIERIEHDLYRVNV